MNSGCACTGNSGPRPSRYRRARDEQCFPFRARQMQELRDERSKRSARHDDRSFGAERTTGSDRDRRRKRLQHRELWLDAAAVDQNRFDRFRDAVAANAVGSIPRHQPDDDAPYDGDDDHEATEHVRGR